MRTIKDIYGLALRVVFCWDWTVRVILAQSHAACAPGIPNDVPKNTCTRQLPLIKPFRTHKRPDMQKIMCGYVFPDVLYASFHDVPCSTLQ